MSRRRHVTAIATIAMSVTLCLCTVLPQAAAAQDTPSLYFPRPLPLWEWRKSAGLTLLTVPRDIAEEEINKAPALDLQSRLGLPLNLSLESRVLFQYVTNHFQAGVRWSHAVGNCAFGLGYDAAFWFGFIQIDGFDNRMSGWLHFPSVSIGCRLGEVKLTAKAEAILVTALRSFAGENEIGSAKNTLAGGALTFVVEQPFWKSQSVMLGGRLALTEFHNQAWFSFSTFDRKLLFSELIFGFIF